LTVLGRAAPLLAVLVGVGSVCVAGCRGLPASAGPAADLGSAGADQADAAFGAAPGERLPDLLLQTCDGATVSTSSLSAEAGVLWLTLHTGWCRSCKQQDEALARLHSELGPAGLVIAVILGEDAMPGSASVSAAFCDAYAQRLPSDMLVLADPGFEATHPFDEAGLPAQVLLDHRGVIRVRETGWLPAQEPAYRQKVEELLAEGG